MTDMELTACLAEMVRDGYVLTIGYDHQEDEVGPFLLMAASHEEEGTFTVTKRDPALADPRPVASGEAFGAAFAQTAHELWTKTRLHSGQ